MTSHHERSLKLFSIAFMVLVFVLTQTVFPFLPETLRRVAKKVWGDAAYRAGRRMCSASAVEPESLSMELFSVLPGDATAFAESGAEFSSTSRIAPGRRQVRCGDHSE